MFLGVGASAACSINQLELGMYELLRKVFLRYLRPDPLSLLIKDGLSVGKNFSMLEGVTIDHSHCWHIRIGDDVTLAPNVHVLAHDASTKKFIDCTKLGKVRIGNRVFVGASTIILPGVTIGNDVIIGAGSVVTSSVPDGVVVAGNPARVLCSIDQFLKKREKEKENCPFFDEAYTLERHITDKMKDEMNSKMGEGFGYIK